MVPQRLPETPTKAAIERALSRLCTTALRRGAILEDARSLLGLDCVRAHLVENAEETHYADALRAYLEDAVDRVVSRERRILLQVVLGLGDKWGTKPWRHKSAKTRRDKAGKEFRPEVEEAVTAGTIRKLHQPHAVEDLAAIIWTDEREARDEPTDDEADAA